MITSWRSDGTKKLAGELSAERKRFEIVKAARDALEHSAGLLDDPRLMDRIGEMLAQNGFAGDQKNAKLAYQALAGRRAYAQRPDTTDMVPRSRTIIGSSPGSYRGGYTCAFFAIFALLMTRRASFFVSAGGVGTPRNRK